MAQQAEMLASRKVLRPAQHGIRLLGSPVTSGKC